MLRLLFEKKGRAVWISHLDLMRLFQRAFKRAELPLKHTQGFNPRPSVSIALPLSVGVGSSCELLDFSLVGTEVCCREICRRLNEKLVEGIRVLQVYEDGRKLKDLRLLSCRVTLEYDNGLPDGAPEAISALFAQPELLVEKRAKNNGMQEQNIIPMIRSLQVEKGEGSLVLNALVYCQNPTLNPALLVSAIERYLPELPPSFSHCARLEIYDEQEQVFR